MKLLKKFFTYIRTRPIFVLTLSIGGLLCIANVWLGYFQLSTRLTHELKEVGNWDSYLYYAVGHGLSEGLVPYKDMYENKPPLVFLLASISYKVFGNYTLLNILAFMCLLIILIIPVIFTIIKCGKNKTNIALTVLLTAFSFVCSTLFMLFSQDKSSQAQIETLGTGCGVLCLFFSSFIRKDNKIYSPFVILSGVFWGLSTMFKEPFALVCGVSLLLFVKNWKELLKMVVFPLMYAILTALLILILSNCFVPYFTIYLNNMFFSHISIYGSPFERMKNIGIIFSYSKDFSVVLPIIYISTLIISTCAKTTGMYHKNIVLNIVLKCVFALKPVAFLYVISFVVGLGGQYYNHHFIFAITYFIALLLDIVVFLSQNNSKFFTHYFPKCKIAKKEKYSYLDRVYANKLFKKIIIYPLIIVFCVFAISTYGKINDLTKHFSSVETQSQEVNEKAEYIDEILDYLNEETYLWVGFNGYTPFAHTKHLPSGPCFAQDVNNFKKDNFYTQEFLRQLTETNVIITPSLDFNLGIITQNVSEYVAENFTNIAPNGLIDQHFEKPTCFNYIVLYRKNIFV